MKKILFIAVMCFPIISMAQKRDNQPFKGASKIIIKDTLSADQNFKTIGVRLNDLGFLIDQKDSEFKSINSRVFEVKIKDAQSSLQIIYVLAKDKSISIYSKTMMKPNIKLLGQYQADPSMDLLTWSKRERNLLMFANMIKLVDNIPGNTIEYSE